jgi:hypothetical protein
MAGAQPLAQPHHEMEHMRLTTSLRPPAVNPRVPGGRGNAEWSREDNHREMHLITPSRLPRATPWPLSDDLETHNIRAELG